MVLLLAVLMVPLVVLLEHPLAVLLQLLLGISEIIRRLFLPGEISGPRPRPHLQSCRAFRLEILCVLLLACRYLHVATCVFHLCVAT
jgi:hypothetical protein